MKSKIGLHAGAGILSDDYPYYRPRLLEYVWYRVPQIDLKMQYLKPVNYSGNGKKAPVQDFVLNPEHPAYTAPENSNPQKRATILNLKS